MGRNLAAGVMTRFEMTKRNKWYSDKNFNLEKEIDNILKDMSDIIDPSMYELIKKEDDCYEFALKPEIFNNNIYELIREIGPLTYPNCIYKLEKDNIDIYCNEFKDKCPLVAKINEDGKYIIEINDDEIREDYPFYPLYWILKNDRLHENVEINAAVILLWMDIGKYDGEDETTMLNIINNMKTKYYDSTLSKALIYYITG